MLYSSPIVGPLGQQQSLRQLEKGYAQAWPDNRRGNIYSGVPLYPDLISLNRTSHSRPISTNLARAFASVFDLLFLLPSEELPRLLLFENVVWESVTGRESSPRGSWEADAGYTPSVLGATRDLCLQFDKEDNSDEEGVLILSSNVSRFKSKWSNGISLYSSDSAPSSELSWPSTSRAVNMPYFPVAVLLLHINSRVV